MALTRIEIHGYRGFKTNGVLNFAVPNGGPGSGLTILTGPNNSGKSSVLECLRARTNRDGHVSFTSGTRNSAVESVEIKYTVNGKDEQLRSVHKGSSETLSVGIDSTFNIFVLPSRRAFQPYFGKSAWDRNAYLNNTTLPAQRSSVLDSFEYRLFHILKNPEPFNAIFKEVIGVEPSWTIDKTDQGQYFLKFFNGSHPHSSDGMGEGIVSIFSIVDSLYDSKPGDFIAIDEPELSLHPSLQKRVAALITRFSSDRQIVISTHSPYFIDLHSLANGGHLARVTTTESGTKIFELSEASKNSIRKLSAGNIFNPHVWGLDARELFFQEDRIIVTEGQEDVLLYPTVIAQLGIQVEGNFFGWGAGGAGNISHVCSVLRDIGFKKVAGLLDSDKSVEAERLKSDFPEYFFATIPADDIRTKAARSASAQVEGLLDEKLSVKPQYMDAAKEMFTALAEHMDA